VDATDSKSDAVMKHHRGLSIIPHMKVSFGQIHWAVVSVSDEPVNDLLLHGVGVVVKQQPTLCFRCEILVGVFRTPAFEDLLSGLGPLVRGCDEVVLRVLHPGVISYRSASHIPDGGIVVVQEFSQESDLPLIARRLQCRFPPHVPSDNNALNGVALKDR
jgi:hypothetical protein